MRYVAIGDSFTEGLGDELPDGSVRGWADLVAAGLAAALDEPVEYANLAVRGRLLAPVVADQLPAALALTPAPTLITLNGGGNDMMRPGCDIGRLVELTEQAVLAAPTPGVRVVLLSGADPTARLPFGSMMHRTGVELTAAVAELAARYDLPFVDVFGDEELRRPGYWSPDRLHLGPAGHRRVAGLVLTALGHAASAHAIDPGPEEAQATVRRGPLLPRARAALGAAPAGRAGRPATGAPASTWTGCPCRPGRASWRTSRAAEAPADQAGRDRSVPTSRTSAATCSAPTTATSAGTDRADSSPASAPPATAATPCTAAKRRSRWPAGGWAPGRRPGP